MNDKLYGSANNKIRVVPLRVDTTDPKISQNAMKIQKQYMGSKGGGSSHGHDTGMLSSVISHTETKRRRHGEAVIIKTQIYHQGVVYQIEEELYSDSDNSS